MPSTNWMQSSIQQDFNCAAGDYFTFQVQPDAAGRGVDNRTQISISQIGGAAGPQGPPGAGDIGVEYNNTTGIASWFTGAGACNQSTSIIRARKVGNMVQLFCQLILITNTGASFNAGTITLVPDLAPIIPRNLPAMFYPSYGPVRCQINGDGSVQMVSSTNTTGQQQFWISSVYPIS
jgi:hypothetical protein